MTEIDI